MISVTSLKDLWKFSNRLQHRLIGRRTNTKLCSGVKAKACMGSLASLGMSRMQSACWMGYRVLEQESPCSGCSLAETKKGGESGLKETTTRNAWARRAVGSNTGAGTASRGQLGLARTLGPCCRPWVAWASEPDRLPFRQTPLRCRQALPIQESSRSWMGLRGGLGELTGLDGRVAPTWKVGNLR